MSSGQNTIEAFNIENPPNYYKRGSGFSSDSYMSEEVANTNDNIIFQEDSLDIGKRNNNLHKAYCGIKGDSDLSCILNITVSAIGDGCFCFPYMMYEGGILVIVIIFIFVTACIYYTLDLLRSFVVDTKYFSFALMTETILGNKWLKVYAFCSFVIYVSMVINYLTSIYNYIQEIFDLDIESYIFQILYFSISIIIEIIICLYISKMNNMMHILSIISIISFFLMVFSLIIISIYANVGGEIKDKFIDENLFFPKITHLSNKILKISTYIMEFVYGYSYHSTFPTVIGYLQKVNNKTTKKVNLISFIIIVCTYILITFSGFLLSKNVPKQLFQDNEKLFEGEWIYLLNPFKCVMVLYTLTLIPVRFIVVRDNYITLIGKSKMKVTSEIAIISLFILICNIFAFGLGNIEKELKQWNLNLRNLIQAFGGMFGVIISFCLPVINYISVNGKRKVKSIIGYIITGFYVIVGFFSFSYTFFNIISGEDKEKES